MGKRNRYRLQCPQFLSDYFAHSWKQKPFRVQNRSHTFTHTRHKALDSNHPDIEDLRSGHLKAKAYKLTEIQLAETLPLQT
jgi:hypothetical protein